MIVFAVVIVVLLAGMVVGWAVHRGVDQRYVERRAQWIARNELAPRLPQPRYADDVIEAELLYATSARLDRPEVTR
ncbi:MAG TPA: hypothetical protein VGL46_05105 [Pseudonocardiaceae bacterium]